jgi:hypothetical protein
MAILYLIANDENSIAQGRTYRHAAQARGCTNKNSAITHRKCLTTASKHLLYPMPPLALVVCPAGYIVGGKNNAELVLAPC